MVSGRCGRSLEGYWKLSESSWNAIYIEFLQVTSCNVGSQLRSKWKLVLGTRKWPCSALLVTTLFGPNFLGALIFFGRNFFWPKIFFDKNFFHLYFFWARFFLLKFFLYSKLLKPKIFWTPFFYHRFLGLILFFQILLIKDFLDPNFWGSKGVVSSWAEFALRVLDSVINKKC